MDVRHVSTTVKYHGIQRADSYLKLLFQCLNLKMEPHIHVFIRNGKCHQYLYYRYGLDRLLSYFE